MTAVGRGLAWRRRASEAVREPFVYRHRSRAACTPACHSTKDSTIFARYMSWGQFFPKRFDNHARRCDGPVRARARTSRRRGRAVSHGTELGDQSRRGELSPRRNYTLRYDIDQQSFPVIQFGSCSGRIRIHQTCQTPRHAKRAGLRFRYEPHHGRGSHGTLYVGDHRTIVKRGKLKPGLFHAMLKQLDIRKEDF